MAKINQSLIFHHFENKENLWKTVKISFLENTPQETCYENLNLKEFLEKIIFARYHFYKNNPDIIRIMLWQKMEPKRKQLSGISSMSPNNWLIEIQKRQLHGSISKKIKAEYIVMMITGFLDAVLFPGGPQLSLEQEKEYMEKCGESLYKILEP